MRSVTLEDKQGKESYATNDMQYLTRVDWILTPALLYDPGGIYAINKRFSPFYRESRMDQLVEDRSGSMSASPQHISTPFGKENTSF